MIKSSVIYPLCPEIKIIFTTLIKKLLYNYEVGVFVKVVILWGRKYLKSSITRNFISPWLKLRYSLTVKQEWICILASISFFHMKIDFCDWSLNSFFSALSWQNMNNAIMNLYAWTHPLACVCKLRSHFPCTFLPGNSCCFPGEWVHI